MIAHLPNAITFARLILVGPIGYCLVMEYWYVVLILLVVAGVSDLLDGFLARHFSWESRVGQIADPIADKLTFGTVIVLLTWQGIIPFWLTIVVLAREVVILLGAVVYRCLFKELEIAPLTVSKINTALQVLLLVLVVIGLANPEAGRVLQTIIDPYGYWLIAAFAIISGATYVFVWSKKAAASSTRTSHPKGTNG